MERKAASAPASAAPRGSAPRGPRRPRPARACARGLWPVRLGRGLTPVLLLPARAAVPMCVGRPSARTCSCKSRVVILRAWLFIDRNGVSLEILSRVFFFPHSTVHGRCHLAHASPPPLRMRPQACSAHGISPHRFT